MKKLLVALFALSAATAGAQKIEIFDHTPVNAAGTHTDFVADSSMVLHATGGRIVFKKVNFPVRKNTTKAEINLTLASKGDRWDKSGSCFIVPADGSAVTLFEVLKGTAQFPAPTDATRGLKGIAPAENYAPALELLRFMTPFGVGHYSDDQLGRRPVYIPFWEKQVSWNQDISQLIGALQGEAWVGVWIDTWTPEGYEVSLDIDFHESSLKCDKIAPTIVMPILNSVAYGAGQALPDLWAYQDVELSFDIPAGSKSATLYYITTGHGGHSGGDEFVKKQNTVYADGAKVVDFTPWRDDCASFRRFNPGSGVWLRSRTAPYINHKGEYDSKQIEESLASSDLSRSNWCPGSCIVPESAVLPTFTAGRHTLRFSIPDATAAEGDKLNHWLVSAYLVINK